MKVSTLALAASAMLLSLGCVKPTSIGPQGINGGAAEATSSLSEIAMGLPDRGQISAQLSAEDTSKLLDGYRLILGHGSPQASTCQNPTATTSEYKVWDTAKIDMSIQNGCHYVIGLQLGKLAADKQSLEKVYFTNVTTQSQGQLLSAGDYGSTSTHNFQLTLQPTSSAFTDKLATENELIIVEGQILTNLDISVTFGPQKP